MKRTRVLLGCALVAASFATSAFGQIQVAGTLQVNVDATALPAGQCTYITNSGALGGVFIAAAANSNATTKVIPQIVALGGDGTKGVLLDGNNVGLRHYTDVSGTTIALPAAGLVGANPIFSVEAWMYKATVTSETGPVAWGTRNNGANISCNWGRHISWGGFSFQGGNWDHGWNIVPTAGSWHHLCWTYDGTGNLNLYRDGVLDKTVFQATAIYIDGTTNNIALGVQHAGTGWSGYANGVLAKVRIHDGVLTPAQVVNNYNAEVASFTVGSGVQDLASGPIHRYSFNQPATNNAVGLTVPDTGSTLGAAAVIRGTSGNASFDGDHLNLNGGSAATSSYVDLPNFLLSSQSVSAGGSGQVTFEMWVNPTSQNWTRLMDFGTNNGTGEITGPGGSYSGRGYFMIAAQVGGDLEHSRVEVVNVSGTGSTFTLGSRMVADVLRGANTFTHYVVSWDEASNVINVYNNGVFVGSYNVTWKMNDVVDVNAWLGRSAWSGDNNMGGAFREFRVYNRVLNAGEVRRNYLEGPAGTLDATALVWNGNASGDWDASSLNWLADAASVNFTNGANVILSDAASGTTTLNLSGTVSPSSVSVANQTKSYTIGGTGKISGAGGLTKGGANTLTFTGSQANDYTGPTVLEAGKTVVSVLANGGSPSALGAATSDPSNLVLKGALSYQGSPVSIDRGILLAGPMSTIDVANSLTLSGQIQGAGQGGFAKTGPGTLTFANTVSNMLSGGAGPGFDVVQGTVIFDGTASGGIQTNRNTGELWVGGTTVFGGNLVISNSTLLQDTWLGVGRGNGSIGNLSTMRLENGRVIIAANGLAMGYQPGYKTNFASQMLTLNGNSSFYIPGNVNVGESSGSSASIFLNGNSWLRGSTIRLGINAGSTGAVTLANSAIITNANFTSIGTAASTATLPAAAGSMVVKDNAMYYAPGYDFNVSDVGATTGGSVGQLDIMNNATVVTGNGYVGKGVGCVGTVNMTGGALIAPGANFQVAQHGQGTFNLSGGTVTIGGWPSIARNSDGVGVLNISGGTFNQTNTTTDMIVGEEGNGSLYISGTSTVNLAGRLRLGNAGTAPPTGTVNLDGGTLITRGIWTALPGVAYSYFNFNGGLLQAAPSAYTDFMSGLGSVYVMSGGARIDSGGNDITIAQDLNDGGNGSMTKLGAGSLTLSGYLSYLGPTFVNQGTLGISTRSIGGGAITVADGAELVVRVQDYLGATLVPSSLTVGSTTGAAITVGLGNFGNPPSAPVNVSGSTFTANGTVTVNVEPSSTLSATGEIPLISYGSLAGAPNFVLGTLPPGVFGYLTNDTASSPKFIGVVVTSIKLPRWEGLAGGFWDIQITTNWIDMGTGLPEYYYQGARAVFDDQALGTNFVNLVTTVTPGGVLASNSLINYTVGGIGRITGGAGITKVGTGTFTVSTTNTYTGPTVIGDAGTLATTLPNNLGNNSALVISNAGTLSLTTNNQKFSSVTLASGTIAATTATVTAPAINLDSGAVNAVLAGGTVSTFGAITDLVSVAGNNTYTGRTVLAGSTLVVPTIANGGAASGVGASSSNPTNLVFSGGGLSYTGPAATTDRGYSVVSGGTFGVSGNLTLLGDVAASGGNFIKSGPAALTYARLGTNILNAGSYYIGQGTVVMNGGASTPAAYLQTNRVNADIWVGFDQVNAGSLIVTNTTLGIANWLALDRGNGTVGSSSKVALYDSVVTCGNMSMGYANGIAGNSSFSVFTLNGKSSFTSAGQCYIGEDAGGDGTIIVRDNSTFALTANWFGLGNRGKGTLILSNYARAVFPADCNLGDVNGGDGTLNIYDNATNLALTLYVGKGNDNGAATGVLNQYGGYVGKSASGGGDWRIGGNSSTTTAGSVGTYNLYGGIFDCPNNFQIGAWGTGTWLQTGGVAYSGNYPVVGRFPGSIGTMTVSGGVFNQTGTGQLLIIGEEGSGTLTVTNTGLVNSANGISIGHASTGIGVVNLDGGTLATTRFLQNGQVGSSSTLNLNGGVLRANANNGNFMVGLSNVNVLARGAIIDTTNFNITIAQPLLADLVSTGGGLTKNGAGVLTLSGANTYTGPTLVNAGALVVNGSIAGAANVKAGAALGGNGTVNGTLTVDAGGAVSAGAGIGSLTLAASPVLNGSVVAEVNRNGGTPLADLITVTGGSIAYNGTLAITNTGLDLQVGDTFKLFQAPSYSGTFTLLSQTPRQVVTWNTANLTVNGTITVATAAPSIPTTRTNISAVVVGNNLEISWPANYTGWWLQGETNLLTVGLSNNWTTVPGSSTTNRVFIPINPVNPTVFFRLVYTNTP